MNTKNDIDIVLTWVDGSDKKWIEQRNKYIDSASKENKTTLNVRYRDWNNLKYIFRGIEVFMPWVRKIHFVTWGHLPNWLNKENERLHIVRHEEFIPKQYLPTFNSNTIELNLFRIPGLAEQFINFNDDMFVIKRVKPEDFFEDGFPKDMACISPQPVKRESVYNVEFNNLQIINSYFTTNDIRKNKKKWLNVQMYGQYALRTAIFMQFKTIIGIYEQHIPFSYLKSEIEKVWESEYEQLNAASIHKFRSTEDNNEWLFRMWQLLSGKFIPRSYKFGRLVSANDIENIRKCIGDKNCKVICINDDSAIENFEEAKTRVNKELGRILKQKSSFEV